MPPKTILVTGCSAGGIGEGIALALARQGHRVFATARNPSKISDRLSSLANVTTLTLDVTSTASVAAAVKTVSESGHGLDVLVNNAGTGSVVPILDQDLEGAQRLFDTNFWGVVRTVQGFSDLIIASRGRIVNISSVGAVLNVPWISMYTASKAALTSFSETLRLELAPFGVSVVVVMAGTVASAWDVNNGEVKLKPDSRYASIRDVIQKWATGEAKPTGTKVEDFANMVVDDIVGKGKGGRVWRGAQSGLLRFVTGWMPVSFVDMLMSYNQGLTELTRLVASQRTAT